jgi:shikimate dehydrogenase
VVTRCAVVGSPIAHSLSPVLHRAAYAELGLDWSYDRFEVSADELPTFVAGLDGSWRGLSLTMPLKVAVLELGEVHPLAALAGAGNTLIFDRGGPRVYNTDIGGLVWAVRRMTHTPPIRVTILGSGATARSALVSVAELGADQVAVLARRPARAEPLARLGARLGLAVTVLDWWEPPPPADLVISTATAGAVDAIANAVSASAPLVLDAIYAPWPTILAETAMQAGCVVSGGRDLLVGQALLQLELMTGRFVAADTLYAALPAA